MEMLGDLLWEFYIIPYDYGYLMLPPGVLHMSAVGCFGRFTFSHLAFHIPTLAGSCLCLFCVVVCLVVLFLCFWFIFASVSESRILRAV